MGGIYHIDNEDQLIELHEEPYDSEERLQKLLEDYPELLTGDQVSNGVPLRWLLISREMGIPAEENGGNRWSVDHFFVDQDAIPSFVEVKRSTNTQIRREVVGQMLDYAANAVAYWPAERIQAEFEAGSEYRGDDPSERLTEFLGTEQNEDEFWQQVQTNLQVGHLRLLFVADHIPAELRRIIEFLNGQMERTEVLAVEIRQYLGEGVRSLVPRVLGQTAASENVKKRARPRNRRWDEPSFMEELRTNAGEKSTVIAAQLIEWTRREIGEPTWGTGTATGSFAAQFNHDGSRHALFSVWTTGNAYIRFADLKKHPPFQEEAARIALIKRFNEIPGVELKNAGGWPEFPLELLSSQSALDQFLRIIRSIEEEIRKQDSDIPFAV